MFNLELFQIQLSCIVFGFFFCFFFIFKCRGFRVLLDLLNKREGSGLQGGGHSGFRRDCYL